MIALLIIFAILCGFSTTGSHAHPSQTTSLHLHPAWPLVTAKPNRLRDSAKLLRRQNALQNTCPNIRGVPSDLRCEDEDTYCNAITSRADVYLRCCSNSNDCVPRTTCIEAGRFQRTSTSSTNSLVLTCSGRTPSCAKYVWGTGVATLFSCGTARTTVSMSTTPSRTRISSSISTRTTRAGTPAPTASGPSTGGRPPPGTGNPPDNGSGPGSMAQDLNTSQKIGIGVGCGGAALVLIGSITYCACGSRRRKRALGKSAAPSNATVSYVEKSSHTALSSSQI